MLEIPVKTPKGNDIRTIGVWLSGGADSALLCYLLAKQIKEHNINVKLKPLTIDYKRPFQQIGVEVREKIEQLLDCKDVFLEHTVYHPPEGVTWTPAELAEQFHIQNYENYKNDTIQALFSGITTNPPRIDQQKFNYGILEDVEKKRGENVPKEQLRYFVHESGKEFIEYKPFFNINKKEIAKLYSEHGLLNTLYPITRSCEHLTMVRGHCGECWWCDERKWAFGRLE